MEGAKTENDLKNANTKNKFLNEKEIDSGMNKPKILPSYSNETKNELNEKENENINKVNKIDIEEEKVIKNMNNHKDKKED